jgi:hypothetical protein
MTHTPPMESFNEINLAAQSLKKLILSNVLNAEGKMVLEHAIDKLSQTIYLNHVRRNYY